MVTAAMINTAQNRPVSAEKTKRESVVQPTYLNVDPHYDVRISPSQSLNVPAANAAASADQQPVRGVRQALAGGFRASALAFALRLRLGTTGFRQKAYQSGGGGFIKWALFRFGTG